MNQRRLYEYRFRNIDQATKIAAWKPIAMHIYEELGRPARVLDPAAGRGEFINAIPAQERWAIDAIAYDEGTYDPDVKVVVSDVFDVALPGEHFDGIWVSNFLEHLGSQQSVAAFLETMHATLAPRGRIAIMGPNFRYCRNEYFDMADHTVALTHKAVAEHLYAAGFQPTKIVPRFLPYSFTGRLPLSSQLTRRYLRMPLAWRVLGKQFLLVGERL